MKKPKIVQKADGTILIQRFSPFRRVEHLMNMIVFILLVLTGFPQKFYDTPGLLWILNLFGGLDNARFVHRLAGIVFTIHLSLHFLFIIVGVLARKMNLSMVPTSKDFRDVLDTLKYYFGRRAEPPLYPKFDYRQKFEYLGLVLGGIVMAFTGLVLLYPELASRIMSGEAILASKVAHSSEALLAFMVLTIWHVYDAIFSPEVFPLDTTIFTGYLTKEQLYERHRLEYERIFGKEPPHGHG